MADWQPDAQVLAVHLKRFAGTGKMDQPRDVEGATEEDLLVACFILTRQLEVSCDVRLAAGGYLLANFLSAYPSPKTVDYIKKSIIYCIETCHENTIILLCSMVTRKHLIADWPGLVEQLLRLLEGPSAPSVYLVLRHVVVEVISDVTLHGDRVCPLMLSHIRSSDPNISSLALRFLKELTSEGCAMISNHSADVANTISDLLQGPPLDDPTVLCTCVLNLFTFLPYNSLQPHVASIFPAMIHYSAKRKNCSALDATELWTTLAEKHEAMEDLRPFLPQLVPVLFANTSHDPDDPLVKMYEQDSFSVSQQREADKKRVVAKRKQAPVEGQEADEAEEGGEADDLSGPEESDEEDGWPKETEWNVRKCSAAALDQLANLYHGALLGPLQPLITKALTSDSWLERESAVLALGAIEPGCSRDLVPTMPSILSCLTALIKDPHPLVRGISCWAVSGYAQWFRSPGLEAVMHDLIQCTSDVNQKVQRDAFSALGNIINKQEESVLPFLPQLLLGIAHGLETADDKLLPYCADTLSTLSAVLNEDVLAETLSIIGTPLLKRVKPLLQSAPKQTPLCPLLEACSSVAEATMKHFEPLARELVPLCIKRMLSVKPSSENTEILVTLLDFVSAALLAAPQATLPLLAERSVSQLLLRCAQSGRPGVLQSLFALVGDIATSDPSVRCLVPILPQLVSSAMVTLQGSSPASQSNAMWSLGLLVKSECDMRPYVPRMVSTIADLLAEIMNIPLSENTVVTLGRISLRYPELILPHLPRLLPHWCDRARTLRIRDVEGKEGLKGLASLYTHEPALIDHEIARQKAALSEANAFVRTLSELVDEYRDQESAKKTT